MEDSLMNSVFYDRVLEIEAQRELDLTHRVTELKACDLAIVLAGLGAVLEVNSRVGICVNGVIEQVEDISTELHVEPLIDRELFHD